MKREGKLVYWDEYGISNNPSREAMEKELEKLNTIQKRQVGMNVSITNSSVILRQTRINILMKKLKCEHDYENPIRLGRANYICPKCKENITLALVYMSEALNK